MRQIFCGRKGEGGRRRESCVCEAVSRHISNELGDMMWRRRETAEHRQMYKI